MAKLSRYFTPALSSKDKDRVLTLLGIKKLVFRLVEECLNKRVITQLWFESGSQTIISEESAQQLPGEILECLPEEISEVCVSHGDLHCESGFLNSNQSFFEQLLPYPHGLFFSHQKLGYKLNFSPAEFALEIHSLQCAVKQLESLLSEFELSILWLQDSHDSFPLLCHFVRKKLIRVGTVPTLLSLCDSFEKGILTPVELRQFFGTNAAFFHVKVNHSNNLSSERTAPLEALRLSIQQTLSHPDFKVIGEPLTQSEPSPFLDFEL